MIIHLDVGREKSIAALEEADTVVVVGTSLKVYPFAGLLSYLNQDSNVILIN